MISERHTDHDIITLDSITESPSRNSYEPKDKTFSTINEETSPDYIDFMQSQNDIVTLLNDCETARFIGSEEELSDLEYFVPLQMLLDRGGDDRRRVEFILRQFHKVDEKFTASEDMKNSKMPRILTKQKSLGLRRRMI